MIREYRPADLPAIMALFHDTVHAVNAADYTPVQLDAWAPADIDMDAWGESLGRHYSLVAVEPGAGMIVGFGDIDPDVGADPDAGADAGHAHLDRLYVHKDRQRRGIAAMLCDRLEAAAPGRTITVHASITARPFFERRGYVVVRGQRVERRGVTLGNYVMRRAATTPRTSRAAAA